VIVERVPDYDAATRRVTEVIAAAVARTPALVLGLPTGRTPLGVYQRLVRAVVDWSRVRTFNLDEFAGLAPSHPASFRAYMEEHFFQPAGVRRDAIGFLRGDAPDLDAECRRYDDAIDAAGGIGLLVLGLGANGHIAFNEPAETLIARTHVATLLEATRRASADRFDGGWRGVPERALTLGMRAILGAARIVVMATGPAKTAAVAATYAGPLTTQCPASWLQVHPDVTMIVDDAAAAGLGAGEHTAGQSAGERGRR
jgi:glucosamine-6-phosphate deaminase